jgi:1-deoxy-D-xylulose-5-phosphate reductoisomerase
MGAETPRAAAPLGLAVLGSTGSIGEQTLDVVRTHPDRLRVVALAAGRNVERIVAQAREFGPEVVALADAAAAETAARELAGQCEVRAGWEAIEELGSLASAEAHVIAITGIAGLRPMLRAIDGGRLVAFATKEPLVAAGELILEHARRSGARLAPIDSEISALWQCLGGERAGGNVTQLLLTGSGGPFRSWPEERIAAASVEDALAHPTWKMGAKITVDSASLMNKGLEVIEAMRFFGLAEDRVRVVIHPQSVIHSMVEFVDGSVLAQLGRPDMRLPIQYALLQPDRPANAFDHLDWTTLRELTFEEPDPLRFPCLRLAFEAAHAGGSAPTVLNAANEVANAAFLAGRIPFGGIAAAVEHAMGLMPARPIESLSSVEDVDRLARGLAEAYIAEVGTRGEGSVQ